MAPLCAGQSLGIVVIGEEEFTRTVTLAADGSFDYPWIGQVDAKGMTCAQLRESLRTKLKRYLKAPVVKVGIVEGNCEGATTEHVGGRSNQVRVFCAGSPPRSIRFGGYETLAGVLTLTGGFGLSGERREVRVIRPARDHHRPCIIVSDMWAYLINGDMAQDIPMEPGDIVVVPRNWTTAASSARDWDAAAAYLIGNLTLDALLWRWCPPHPTFTVPSLPRSLW